MKRALPIVPLVLFILLNACTGEIVIDGPVQTAVKQTEIASSFTPTIATTPTDSALRRQFVNLLNLESVDTFSMELQKLEHTIGATYEVLDVNFKNENGITAFVVNLNCTCGPNIPCCRAERMFVVIIQKMYPNSGYFFNSMPAEVKKMTVKCLKQLVEFSEVSADWEDVKSFLRGDLSGSQFGLKVRP